MISYKGMKCYYLGLKRWRVDAGYISFNILCTGGIGELLSQIDRWEGMI